MNKVRPMEKTVKGPVVTQDLTRQVAHLARLELTDAEVEIFTPQLRDILRYVETLKEIDVSEVEPLTHPLDISETPMREDAMRYSPKNAEGKPKVLDSAPEVFQDGYKVPPIL